MPNLFARKSIESLKAEAAAHDDAGFKRSLSAMNLTALGIGAVIGAGFFVLTGEAAAKHAGPAVALAFIIGGIVCAFAGLCYAEMASTVPVAGSAYTYAYATMGELAAWIIGWDLILEYMCGAITVSIGWSGYMVSILHDMGITVPPWLTSSPGMHLINVPDTTAMDLKMRGGWQALESVQALLTEGKVDTSSFATATALFNLPAMIIVAMITALLVVGIQESARFNNVIVVIKIIVILLFIGFGITYVSTDNWGGPFIPPNTGKFGEFGWSGIFRAAGLTFFAYIGFDAVSTTAQEAKNPQRDMPIGILGSLAICTLLYVLAAVVLTGIVSYKQLNVPDPVAVAIEAIHLNWLSKFIKLGAIAGLTSVVLVMLLSQPRIFFAMSKDGLLPESVSKIHPRFRTPYITTIITGFIVMVGGGFLPRTIVNEMTSIGTLFAFAVVSAGVLVLRIRRPEIERPFRVPFVWFTAPMGVLTSVGLMLSLPIESWYRLIIWLFIGLVIYFLYGAHHSHLGKIKPVQPTGEIS